MRKQVDLDDYIIKALKHRVADGEAPSVKELMEVIIINHCDVPEPEREWSTGNPPINYGVQISNVFMSEKVEVVMEDGEVRLMQYLADANTGETYWYAHSQPLGWRYLK